MLQVAGHRWILERLHEIPPITLTGQEAAMDNHVSSPSFQS